MDLPKTPSFRLDGRRALVTGASSGIGLGSAVALAEAGAHVVLAARRRGPLEEAANALGAAGYSAEVLVLDVGDLDAVAAAIDAADSFDIVVNSAGLARHAPADDTTPDDYDTAMAINLRAAYFLSTYSSKAMRVAGKKGSIIHISSQMGHVGGIDRSVYCAAKHGLEGMTKSMAIEWGKQGIRINTLCPTFIRTPLTQSTFDNVERRTWIEGKIKLDRIGEVEDIMGAVVFLASDASALVTGAALMVDGGWTAG
ncbi:SDR family oxidoreductase [Pseudorhodobacter turbinis]|uniref:SDR family oxidoreductase n=1 Tax=Pseudorhodobacter turbinis TaxID=2500533 RepID=A0A4P8EHM0_9RHOB|nr:SDR family oxidoreductase [Pseudorhodobacter turbinis]QCO56456.1 SDR family oxidoreductase [Pseudorhodobacter turbinis]